MRGIGAFVGGVLFIAAIFAGWWAIDRAQEHLPGPVNAVIDAVKNAGAPNGSPAFESGRESPGTGDPLAACPEFADDVRVVEQALLAAAPEARSRADANNALIERELMRVADGGAAVPLASSGVDAALTDQAEVLTATTANLRAATFQTPEARALATGIAAASARFAEASRSFVAQAAGTPRQWQQWTEAVSGPIAQVQAASKALGKCPA